MASNGSGTNPAGINLSEPIFTIQNVKTLPDGSRMRIVLMSREAIAAGQRISYHQRNERPTMGEIMEPREN